MRACISGERGLCGGAENAVFCAERDGDWEKCVRKCIIVLVN